VETRSLPSEEPIIVVIITTLPAIDADIVTLGQAVTTNKTSPARHLLW
jgi:hypothetical protein